VKLAGLPQTITGDKTFSGTTTITGSVIANALTITPTELGYLDGTTSNIQTQINTKANDADVVKLAGPAQTITGDKTFSGTTTITGSVIANALTITPTELGYLDGTTSNIQTQINTKANDADVVKLAGPAQTITGDKEFTGTITTDNLTNNFLASSANILVTDSGFNEMNNNSGDNNISNNSGYNFITTNTGRNILQSGGAALIEQSTTFTDIKNETIKNLASTAFVVQQTAGTDKLNIGASTTSISNTNINIQGITSFASLPISSITPTTANQLTTKTYVDSAISGGLGGYVTISGTQTITGDKTLSGPTTLSGTTTISGSVIANSLTITPTELGYLDGASSNLQSQITARALDSAVVKLTASPQTITGNNTFSGTTTLSGPTTLSGTTTISGSVIANSLTITPTELGYLDGASSNIQAQINSISGGLGGYVTLTGASQTITGPKIFQNDSFLVENAAGTDKINVGSLTTTISNTNITISGATNMTGTTTFTGDIVANALTITPTELGYLDGASSNLQTQITARALDSAVVKLTASPQTITGNNTFSGTTTLSGTTNLDGNIVANLLTITPTELGYLDGASSNLQTQINSISGGLGGYVTLAGSSQTITGAKIFQNDNFLVETASGGDRLNITATTTNLFNINNTITSSGATASANLITATTALGGNTIRTDTGQNLIENTGVGSNLIKTTGAGTNTIRSVTGQNLIENTGGSNLLEALTTGTNTIRTDTGQNLITSANTSSLANYITATGTGGGTTISATSSTGQNSLSSSGTSGGSNIISATAAGGGNTMRTSTGQNLITNTGAGSNLITTTGAGTNTIRSATGQNLIENTAGSTLLTALTTGTNTIRTDTGQNLIENTGAGSNLIRTTGAGTNTIRSATGQNLIENTAGSTLLTALTTGTNTIRTATGQNLIENTGAGSNLIRTTGAGTNTIRSATGQNLIENTAGSTLLTALTTGTNTIRTATGQNLIENTGAGSNLITTTGAGTNTLSAVGVGGENIIDGTTNRIRVGGTDKGVVTSTLTTLTNPTITNVASTAFKVQQTAGTDKINVTSVETTLSNEYLTVTSSKTNTLTAQQINTASANLLDATGTGGGNTLRASSTTGSNTLTSARTSAGANLITATAGLGGNTIRATTGQNLIENTAGSNLLEALTTGTNTIRSATGTNTLTTANTTATANLIDATGTGGGNTIRTTTGTNSITSTSGNNILNTTTNAGSNRLQINGVDKIVTTPTITNLSATTSMNHSVNSVSKLDMTTTDTNITNTNQFFTSGDQFTVQCFNNRMNVDSTHFLKVATVDKLTMTSTTTTLTNSNINLSTIKVTSRPYQWFLTGASANATATAGTNIGRFILGQGYFSLMTAYGGAPTSAWDTINAVFTAPSDGLYSIQLNVFQSQGNIVSRTIVLECASIPSGGRQYMFFNSAQTTNEAAYQCSQTLWLTSGQTFRFVNDGGSSIQLFYGPTHTSLNIIRIY
jgi:hypothetical protein